MTALRIGPHHFLPDAALLREIIVTGLPSFLQTAGQSAVVLLVNRTLGRCGQLLCFAPMLVVLTRLFGSDGVWYAFPVSNLLALGISSVTMYRAF